MNAGAAPLNAFSPPLSDDDEGQFELEEDEEDRQRRAISESPVNKVQPIPDATSFFILKPENQ